MKVFEPKFKPPHGANTSHLAINHPGIMTWKNYRNNFTVAVCHYTADPAKRSEEWFRKAVANLRQDQIEREFEIDFTSRAGQKAFWYLQAFPSRWQIPDIDLYNVPKHWRIIAALDFGSTNPTSIHIYAIDENNYVYSIWEFYKPSHYKEIARALKGEHKDYPHPLWKRISKIMVDPSIFRNDQQDEMSEEMQSIADLLRSQGIHNIYPGTNNRVAGLERVKDMLRYFPENPEAKPYLFFCKRCVNQWREMTNLIYDELSPAQAVEKNNSEDIKKKDDHCFVAGTMISTPHGMIAIEKLKQGDLVITRGGAMPVAAAGPTEIAQTYRLHFSNGSELVCTGNHPIWTENRGFVRADELRYEDICVANQSPKKSFSMELFFAGIHSQKERMIENISNAIQHTTKKTLDICIEKFGNFITEKFQIDGMYTTRMGIPLITISPILNACPSSSTMKITVNSTGRLPTPAGSEKYSKKTGILQRCGMGQKMGANGILSMLKKLGKIWSIKRCLALYAENHSRQASSQLAEQDSAQITVELKTSENSGKPRSAYLVKRSQDKVAQVYNMIVCDFHEYYANGILVHNSYDELRYALMSVQSPSGQEKKPPPGEYTLETIEKEMNQSYDEGQDSFY